MEVLPRVCLLNMQGMASIQQMYSEKNIFEKEDTENFWTFKVK